MSSADTASPLLAHLRARIEREGPLSVEAFMGICLAHPEHGYCRQRETIGAAGDFVTAPEMSQVFGELIGLWAAVVWQAMGEPAPFGLVELGPGRGTLLSDALRATRSLPRFRAAAKLHLIETSAPLREVQARALAARFDRNGRAPPGQEAPIAWHEAIGTVPEEPLIVLANEFLDALPIRQLVSAGGAWHERVVELDAEGGLRFAVGAVASDGLRACNALPGTIAELRPGEDALIAALARRAAPLVALFIDYGPIDRVTGDTLQAVHRHAWVDPLSRPGRADLTAHVAFAGLADKARAAGLAADGPITQAEFLGRLGVVERALRLMAANPKEAGAIEAGVQRLISPAGMGGLVKVLAIRSKSLPQVVPFLGSDRIS